MELRIAMAAVAVTASAGAYAADLPTTKPQLSKSCFATFSSWLGADACPLTFAGVTLYGAIDLGVGYSSQGARFNRVWPQGVQELISKQSNGAKVQLVPNALGPSNVGVRLQEPLAAGWALVGDFNFGFDPYSLRLSDGPGSEVENNDLPLARQSANGDSSRAGQWDNTRGYAGVSNSTWGTLTFGRQYTFSNDAVGLYDPTGGGYGFSLIGNSSTYVAGTGDTEVARYNTSVKYQVSYENFRAGALVQAGGYEQGNGSNGAYQLDVGGDVSNLSVDAIYSHAKDAVALSTYNAPTPPSPNDLKATLANIDAGLFAARYSMDAWRLFAGYEYARFSNPSDAYPHGFGALGGTEVLPGAVNAAAYTRNRILQVFWMGARYAARPDLDVAVEWDHGWQNDYALAGVNCGPNKTAVPGGFSPQGSASSACAGAIDTLSTLIDYRPAKRVDLYAGVLYSVVSGGIANGYMHSVNVAPTAGMRLSF